MKNVDPISIRKNRVKKQAFKNAVLRLSNWWDYRLTKTSLIGLSYMDNLFDQSNFRNSRKFFFEKVTTTTTTKAANKTRPTAKKGNKVN